MGARTSDIIYKQDLHPLAREDLKTGRHSFFTQRQYVIIYTHIVNHQHLVAGARCTDAPSDHVYGVPKYQARLHAGLSRTRRNVDAMRHVPRCKELKEAAVTRTVHHGTIYVAFSLHALGIPYQVISHSMAAHMLSESGHDDGHTDASAPKQSSQSKPL